MSGLRARLRVAARGVDVGIDVAEGQVLALLGPNGCGKSTVLAVLAGLLAPDEGRVSLGEEVLVDTDTGVFSAPHRRGVVLMAQEALLFPHLRAADNVAFGIRARGVSRAAARREAAAWLAEVYAVELAGRRPRELSGGQAQRVAVARALAARPRLLLLDEPMAALDVAGAPGLRQVLRRVLREPDDEGRPRSAIVVTHDVVDALALADRVAVLEAGRVVETGPTREVLTRPRSAFAARLTGLNLVGGTAVAGGLRAADGRVLPGTLDADCTPGAPAVAVFAPATVAVGTEAGGGALPVVVTSVEPAGARVFVRAGDLAAEVDPVAAAQLDLAPGQTAWFAPAAGSVAVRSAVRSPARPGPPGP